MSRRFHPIRRGARRFRPILLFILFDFLLVGCVSIEPISRPFDEAAWADLVEGIRSYEAGRYDEAARRLLHMIETHPGSPLLEEGQWLLAKSYDAAKERDAAVQELHDFLKNYPRSTYADEARALLIKLEQSDKNKRSVAFFWSPSPRHPTFEEEIPELQKQGVNTLIVRVFDNKPGRSGLYFKGRGSPVLEDRLEAWVQSAHRAGLRLIVEAPLREMRWATEFRPEWRDQKYDREKRRLAPIDKMDLFNDDVQRMVLQLYRDLSRYPIDGIYLRDIYYEREEGWTDAAVQLYQGLFSQALSPSAVFGTEKTGSVREGRSDPTSASFWRWVGWRSRFVSDLIGKIRLEIQADHPRVQWGVGIPAELILEPSHGLAELSGDFLELKQSQFDFYVLIPGSGAAPLGVLLDRFSKYAVRPEEIWLQRPISEAGFLLSASSPVPAQGFAFSPKEER